MSVQWLQMRPKARGLEQHGGPPGWLEEWPRRVRFCTWWKLIAVSSDEPHHLPLSGADLLLNVHQNTVRSYVTQGRLGLELKYTHAFSVMTTYQLTAGPYFSAHDTIPARCMIWQLMTTASTMKDISVHGNMTIPCNACAPDIIYKCMTTPASGSVHKTHRKHDNLTSCNE
jgi:hypothetical protein